MEFVCIVNHPWKKLTPGLGDEKWPVRVGQNEGNLPSLYCGDYPDGLGQRFLSMELSNPNNGTTL